MARFVMPRAGRMAKPSRPMMRPGLGFGPFQGMVDGPRKRVVNAGSAARKPVGGRIGGTGGGMLTGMGAGLGGTHRGMVIRHENAAKAAEKGKYGYVRPKRAPAPQRPMNSSAAPRQNAQRAVKAARGGSRKAAKRISRY